MNPALAYTQNMAQLADLFGFLGTLALLLISGAVAIVLAVYVPRLFASTPHRRASVRPHRSSPPVGASRSASFVSAGHGDAVGEALHTAYCSTSDETQGPRPRPHADRFSVTASAAGQGGAK